MEQPPPGRIKDIRAYRDSFIGMSMLACLPFLIFGALQVYGWLAAIGMFLLWLVLLFLGSQWFMPRPRGVIGLGVFGFLVWLGVVLLNR